MSHEDRHRPATASRHHLKSLHINPIYIRSFLPVHLDRHEHSIQLSCYCRYFEHFPFHYMTPVTGGIAYREEYRFVFAPRFFKRLVAPGVPIYGVERMLEEIRAFFIYKSVRSVSLIQHPLDVSFNISFVRRSFNTRKQQSAIGSHAVFSFLNGPILLVAGRATNQTNGKNAKQ